MFQLTYRVDGRGVEHNDTVAVQRSAYDVRIACAIAVIKVRRRASSSEPDRLWKKQAKILKDEIVALRQELHEVNADGLTLDSLPCIDSCECDFSVLETSRSSDADELISTLSVQRFLKNLRILDRAKKSGRRRTGEPAESTYSEDLKGYLALVIDFVVDFLGDPTPVSDSKYLPTYMDQSVKFIEGAIPHLLQDAQKQELQVETSVNKLTSALRMNILNFLPEKGLEAKENIDKRVWVQKIFLGLGNVQFIGQQFLLTVSRLIVEVTETLVRTDPFHTGGAQTYDNMFFLLQLFERLLSDHPCSWAKTSSSHRQPPTSREIRY